MWGKGTVLDRDGWHRWMMWYWLNVHGSCDTLICEKGTVICAYRTCSDFCLATAKKKEKQKKRQRELSWVEVRCSDSPVDTGCAMLGPRRCYEMGKFLCLHKIHFFLVFMAGRELMSLI